MNNEKRYLLDAEWENDCQGKKDYDGKILAISTRYWPRGGSAFIIGTDGSFSDNSSPERQHIKPSAISSLTLYYKSDEASEGYDPGSIDLIEKEFKGETEEEVKSQVEEWAQSIMDKVVVAIQNIKFD